MPLVSLSSTRQSGARDRVERRAASRRPPRRCTAPCSRGPRQAAPRASADRRAHRRRRTRSTAPAASTTPRLRAGNARPRLQDAPHRNLGGGRDFLHDLRRGVGRAIVHDEDLIRQPLPASSATSDRSASRSISARFRVQMTIVTSGALIFPPLRRVLPHRRHMGQLGEGAERQNPGHCGMTMPDSRKQLRMPNTSIPAAKP